MPSVKTTSKKAMTVVKNVNIRRLQANLEENWYNKPNKENESAAEKMTEKSKKQVSKPRRKRAADSSSSPKNDKNKTVPVPPKVPKIKKIINVTVYPVSQKETDSAVQGLLEAEEREERIVANYGEYIPKRW
ncbi:hypothetical protein GCK72_009216 [Caenorhabditis remanei]|uniref:Uncharacterized protein n=1 Tax=Caenorhabditis remanei TaxID=31234 RepID=A0A6A5H358_CAERE|nr:hypothetical protein GCK72_009216 [Caenorhabditis remanei]KAF1760963.1 hypothetical protein GCK72_009216 [Caenorhabditis remanei]